MNILIVWLLTGLWHGANWNFGLWGLYYGILLIAEKLLWGNSLKSLPNVLQNLYTILAFLIGWVLFRIEDVATMAQWFSSMFGRYGLGSLNTLNAIGVLHLWPWFLIASIFATPMPREAFRRLTYNTSWEAVYTTLIVLIMSGSIISLVVGGFNPFIYFRF